MIKKLLLVAAILGGMLTKMNAQAGAALSFDGTNDYVAVPYTYSGEYTMEVWVRLNTLINRNIIAGTTSAGPVATLPLSLRVNASGNFEHLTYSSLGPHILVSPTVLTTGTWYHVVISAKSGGNMKIVVNGVETISSFQVSTLNGTTNTLRLGQNTQAGFNYFNGTMDEFRVWNRQLCIDEIINNKDGEILTTAPGLVTNIHFNQGLSGSSNSTVTSALDASGFNRNGTLNGFALSGTASNWVAPGAVTSGVAVTTFALPTVSVTPSATLVCGGAQNTFTASGAFNYSWSSSFSGQTNTATNIYFITTANIPGNWNVQVLGTDVNGCYGSPQVVTFSVVNTPVLPNEFGYFCSGSSYTISPNVTIGGPITSYTFSTGSSIITPTSTTTYTVIGTNAAGCVSGAATGTVEVCGPSGKALNMNGTDDQLNTGILYSDFTNNWTLECWAKSPSIPTSAEYNGPMYGANMGIVWDHNTPTYRGSATVQDGTNSYYAASYGSLLANTWYHFAATYDGTTLRAYKNGVLTGSVTTAGGLATASGGLTFGRHPSLNQFWNGTIDEARVWTVTRTCAEINQSMNTELIGNETGLKAYYKFNEGIPEGNNTSITSTSDASGNNYNCSLAGFTRTGTVSNYLMGAPFNNTLNPLCLTTGVNEINTTNTFLIYPNPASSVLNIETEQQKTISIINVLGEVLKTETINGTYKLDLSNLSTGVYFIQDAKSGRATKFIKE
jgi:hypothetical protein